MCLSKPHKLFDLHALFRNKIHFCKMNNQKRFLHQTFRARVTKGNLSATDRKKMRGKVLILSFKFLCSWRLHIPYDLHVLFTARRNFFFQKYGTRNSIEFKSSLTVIQMTICKLPNRNGCKAIHKFSIRF